MKLVILTLIISILPGCSNLRTAAYNGKHEKLRNHIAENNDPRKLNMAFSSAIFGEELESMKILLEAGADINWSLGDLNNLGWAVKTKNYEIVKFLLDNGVNRRVEAYRQAVNKKLFRIAKLIKTGKHVEENKAEKEHEKLDDKTRFRIERDRNTKLIVDHFINNIWNKPLNQLFGPEKETLHTKSVKKPYTYGTIPSEIKDCNPADRSPYLSSKLSQPHFYNDDFYQYNGFLGFHSPKKTMDPVTRFYNCEDHQGESATKKILYTYYSKRSETYLPRFYMTTNSIHEIRRMLVERGVPLEWCYVLDRPKRYNGYQQELGCSLDWWKVNTSGYIFTIDPSLKIVMENNVLVKFSFQLKKVKGSERNLSLSEIYDRKSKDKKYWKMVKRFSDLVLDRANYFIREKRQKASAQAASNKAYHQAVEAKFKRMEAQSKSNSYKSTTPSFVNKPVMMLKTPPRNGATQKSEIVIKKTTNKGIVQEAGPLGVVDVHAGKLKDKHKLTCMPFNSRPVPYFTGGGAKQQQAVKNWKAQYQRLLKTQPEHCHERYHKEKACGEAGNCPGSKPGKGTLK